MGHMNQDALGQMQNVDIEPNMQTFRNSSNFIDANVNVNVVLLFYLFWQEIIFLVIYQIICLFTEDYFYLICFWFGFELTTCCDFAT